MALKEGGGGGGVDAMTFLFALVIIGALIQMGYSRISEVMRPAPKDTTQEVASTSTPVADNLGQ